MLSHLDMMAAYLVCMSFRPDLGVALLDIVEYLEHSLYRQYLDDFLSDMLLVVGCLGHTCRLNQGADLLDTQLELLVCICRSLVFHHHCMLLVGGCLVVLLPDFYTCHLSIL